MPKCAKSIVEEVSDCEKCVAEADSGLRAALNLSIGVRRFCPDVCAFAESPSRSYNPAIRDRPNLSFRSGDNYEDKTDSPHAGGVCDGGGGVVCRQPVHGHMAAE